MENFYPMNLKLKYIFFYLLIICGVFSLLYFEKNLLIERHLQETNKEITQKYFVFYNKYKELANLIFTLDINRPSVIDIFKDAYKSDKNTQKIIRKKLFEKLSDCYDVLKYYNVKQLHFHLPDNKSFLRFHRPEKFGDDLTNIRETVVYANRNKQTIDGFEEGRIFNGFRFLFPMFDKDKNHIGSVEISFSTLVFNREFYKNHQLKSWFFIKKDIVDKKLFQNEKSNYIHSPFEKYYIEKISVNKLNDLYNRENYFNGLSKYKQMDFEKKTISIVDNQQNTILTFMPIQNTISKKYTGLFVVEKDCDHILMNKEYFYKLLFGINFLILLIFIFIYRNHQKQITLKTIISEADSGIGHIATNGNFKKVNQVYSKLLGYSNKELLSKNCFQLTLDEDKDRAKVIFEEAQKKGFISKERKRCIRKDNSIIHLEFSLKKLPSNDGFIVVINSLEDKIELERLNNQLQIEVNNAIEQIRQKDQMLHNQSKLAALGEMIDAIAHQLKTPLGIIKIYSQQIQIYTDDKKEIINCCENQLRHIDYLVNTIEEFRSFFRPNTKTEKIPIKAVIDSVKMLMKDEFIQHRIQVNIIGETTAVFEIIPNEFKHVLINILNNSKDAFNENNIENRIIEIDIKEKSLSISDNAGGISKNNIDNIFEANFTTKNSDKGTGIGLYITRQILEKIGAKISVENIKNGVRFDIVL